MQAPSASRQIAFHQLLVAARTTWLRDALSRALEAVDPAALKSEYASRIPTAAQKALAGAGIRDEFVFPSVTLLTADPRLLGYYRLLLGASQKAFYSGETGFGRFKAMEADGILSDRNMADLPELVNSLTAAMAELVEQLSPSITLRDVEELPLLTLGSQFQGSNNNSIGRQATKDVFLAIHDIVASHLISENEDMLELQNAAGRLVRISLAADPDVRVEEHFGPSDIRPLLAIEIKGGTDRSNAHNRAGEAEKSHQKAKAEGFVDFWTIIALKGLDGAVLAAESPTSRRWFDAAQILGRVGPDWLAFQSGFAGAAGIPVPD